MRQDSRKTAKNVISMEEYLKKRQAVRQQETLQRKGPAEAEPRGEAAVLKLAEMLYV